MANQHKINLEPDVAMGGPSLGKHKLVMLPGGNCRVQAPPSHPPPQKKIATAGCRLDSRQWLSCHKANAIMHISHISTLRYMHQTFLQPP